MQKSGPGTEAQFESISSGDRNLIQVILLFYSAFNRFEGFLHLSDTCADIIGPGCTSGGHQEILVWNFWSP